jgi:hypothetical protein
MLVSCRRGSSVKSPNLRLYVGTVVPSPSLTPAEARKATNILSAAILPVKPRSAAPASKTTVNDLSPNLGSPYAKIQKHRLQRHLGIGVRISSPEVCPIHLAKMTERF